MIWAGINQQKNDHVYVGNEKVLRVQLLLGLKVSTLFVHD